MNEAGLQDGHKRRLAFEPASERGSDKWHRTCCHREDCELRTKVLAQESTIRNLAGVIEDLLGRLAALEQPSSAISIDRTRTKSSKRQSCPADNCSKAFDRTDHLHRHIRGVYDEPHLSLTRVLDQKHCVLCKKDFKRPCDLVRHEKSFHDETYISRAYKFVSHPNGFARAPTPPDTSSNASADLNNLASEYEQEDDEVSKTRPVYEGTAQNGTNILSDFLDQNMSLASDQPHEFSSCFDAAQRDCQGYSNHDIDDSNNAAFIRSGIPIHNTVFFNATPIDYQSYSDLNNSNNNQADFMHGYQPFFSVVPDDIPLTFTQELWYTPN